jgi:hypothetical protein
VVVHRKIESNRVQAPPGIAIPANIMRQYREVIVAADIMYVNQVPFLVSISRSIKFCLAELFLNQQVATILTGIKLINSLYKKRGFTLTTLLMDGEFEPLRGDLADMGITLNTASCDEHVLEIERHIRTLKERIRCVYNTLSFKRVPARMVAKWFIMLRFG